MAHAALRTVQAVPSRSKRPRPIPKTPSSAGRILSIPPALTSRNVYPSLPRLVTAHRDDPLSTHLFRGEHTETADRAVTDDRDRHARLDVGCVGGEPAGAHDVRERQQARDQVVRRNIPGGHQRAMREWDAQHRPPAPRRRTPCAGRTTDSRLAVGTGVVGCEEGTDDEPGRCRGKATARTRTRTWPTS